MNVTINTDASFCPEHKVAGFAFYIKCNLGTITRSGPLKHPKNPEDCELKALANAVYTLQKSHCNNGRITKITINSDCLNMFEKIGKKSKNHVGAYIAKHLSVIREKNTDLLPKGQFYFLKHVKAHNGTPDARSWVNDWCDKNAKIEMLKERAAILSGQVAEQIMEM